MSEAPVFTTEQRAAKEKELRELSAMLKEVAASTESSSDSKDKSKELIVRFASEVDDYVVKVQEAATEEEAEVLVKEATVKKERWMKMLNMLAAKEQTVSPQEAAALAQAEAQMKQMSAELRKTAETGNATVVKGITAVADQVDAALEEFLAAGTSQAKWAAYTKMEEARSWWLKGMTQMKENMEANLKQSKKLEKARQKEYDAQLKREAAGVEDAPKKASCYVADDVLEENPDAGFTMQPQAFTDASNSCDV